MSRTDSSSSAVSVQPPPSKTALVWLEPEQTDLARRIAKRAGLALHAAGSPTKGRSGAVASELAASSVDDLRLALYESEANTFLILAPGDFGTPDDVSALTAAKARGADIFTLEPIPAATVDLTGSAWRSSREGVEPAQCIHFIPQPASLPVFRDAQDVIASFGEVRSMSITSLTRPGEGSLGARLSQVMSLIASLLGEPETIVASYVSVQQGSSVYALPGETLRDLHGDLVGAARLGDGRAASFFTSNQAARWHCAVTLLGPEGRLELRDTGFDWIAPDGRTIDSHDSDVDADDPAVSSLGSAIAHVLSRRTPPPTPAAIKLTLAMAQTALLSARTGQPEYPSTILRMAGG